MGNATMHTLLKFPRFGGCHLFFFSYRHVFVLHALLAAFCPLFAHRAHAQQKGTAAEQSGSVYGDSYHSLSLLQKKQIQDELKLDQDQRAKLAAIERALTPSKSRKEALEKTSKRGKAAERVLSPAQLARFQEISLQQEGILALTDSTVAELLGIDADQLARLRSLQSKYIALWNKLPFGERRNRDAGDQPDAMKDLMTLLTPAQWQKYEKMRGAPFKVDLPPFPSVKRAVSAEREARRKQWQGMAWSIRIDLDMPRLDPQAVQFAIFDEDPVPAFTAEVKLRREYNHQQLKQAPNEASRERLRPIQMAMDWNQGFKRVTGDQLSLLTKSSGPPVRHSVGATTASGKRWIVTKTVDVDGKPVCWCIPVEVRRGESIDVTLNESTTFDLQKVYDNVMKGR